MMSRRFLPARTLVCAGVLAPAAPTASVVA
jgi:hypothetical protein